MIRRERDTVAAAKALQSTKPRPAAPELPVLALQRAAGNRAVTSLLARDDKTPSPSDQPPRTGGCNEKPQGVGGSHRFPVTGLAGGSRKTDAQEGTRESAVMPVGDAGTVRDVEADLIPQQLAHSAA